MRRAQIYKVATYGLSTIISRSGNTGKRANTLSCLKYKCEKMQHYYCFFFLNAIWPIPVGNIAGASRSGSWCLYSESARTKDRSHAVDLTKQYLRFGKGLVTAFYLLEGKNSQEMIFCTVRFFRLYLKYDLNGHCVLKI